MDTSSFIVYNSCVDKSLFDSSERNFEDLFRDYVINISNEPTFKKDELVSSLAKCEIIDDESESKHED